MTVPPASPTPLPSVAASDVPDDAYVLDVREPYEWEAGHISSAVHLPMGELQARHAEVPRDREVVVVCHLGGRSAQVAAALNRAGWRAVNLAGGMEQWAAAGRPMVSETGAPPVVA